MSAVTKGLCMCHIAKPDLVNKHNAIVKYDYLRFLTNGAIIKCINARHTPDLKLLTFHMN